MVVEENGVYTIADGMVGLARADVDGECCVDNSEDEKIKLYPEELSNAKGVVSTPSPLLFVLLVFFRRRKVGLYHRFSLPLSLKVWGGGRGCTSSNLILCSGVKSFPPAFSSRL